MSSLFSELLNQHYEEMKEENTIAQNKAVLHDLVYEAVVAAKDGNVINAIHAVQQCVNFFNELDKHEVYDISDKLVSSAELLLCSFYFLAKGQFTNLGFYIKDESKLQFLLLTVYYQLKQGDFELFMTQQMDTLVNYLIENLDHAATDCESFVEMVINNKKGRKGKKFRKGKVGIIKVETHTHKHATGKDECLCKKLNNNSVPTQTENQETKKVTNKHKSKNASTQTETRKVKTKEVQVQQGELIESEILNVVLGIKENLQESNKKDDDLRLMRNELTNLKNEYESYKHQKESIVESDKSSEELRLLKIEFKKLGEEFENYKNQRDKEIAILEKRHELDLTEHKKTVDKLKLEMSFSKELTKKYYNCLKYQLHFRERLETTTFNLYDSKCRSVITFLKSIKGFIARGHIVDIDNFNMGVNQWMQRLKVITSVRNEYYARFIHMQRQNLNTDIKSEQITLNWPELPEVFETDPVMNSIITYIYKNPSEDNSLRRSLNVKQNDPPPMLIKMQKQELQNKTSKRPQRSAAHSALEKHKQTTDVPSSSKSVRKKETQVNTSECSSDKELYIYLMDKTGLTEDILCSTLTNLITTKNMVLSGMPKEQILKELRGFMQHSTSNRCKNPWTAATNNMVEWHHEESETTCVICFDEFNKKNCYMLPCKHNFHKQCIKSWLKTSNGCPICRVHTVLDEDFPPLF